MEKITLKPVWQEINYPSPEPNTNFDAFAYAPTHQKNRHLGYFYLIGQAKYGEENMAYVLNLLSSLAKREYYSENGSIPESPRQALDLTLRKINGVLEDFFKNKDLKLNLGLLVLAGEQIYIAKLGKFKVLLARQGEIIDILNNVDLFHKEHIEEKQFVNIISGKILANDKILALYPTRPVAVREKSLRNHLLQNSQEKFISELASWNQTAKNFHSCGLHIEVKKFKEEEIPIRSAYQKSSVVLTSVPVSPDITPTPQTNESFTTSLEPTPHLSVPSASPASPPSPSLEVKNEEPVEPKQAKIISADMALIKRKNIFEKISNLFVRRPSYALASPKKIGRFLGLAVVVIIALFLAKNFIFKGSPGQSKALRSVAENVRLAETQITKNDNSSARELLSLSLSSLQSLGENSKPAEELKVKINSLIDRLDLVNVRQPERWISLDASATHLLHLASLNPESIFGISQNKSLLQISPGSQKTIAENLGNDGPFIFSLPDRLAIFNGSDQFSTVPLAKGKVANYTLKEPSPVQDADLYQGNLYLLTDNSIYKYADVLTGGNKKESWFNGLAAASKPLALTVDGNIFVLTVDGTVTKFFKGQPGEKIQLNAKFSAPLKFFTAKDSPYFYLATYSDKKVRAFDRQTGNLVTTFKFEQASLIKDFAFGSQYIYALDDQQNIWRISYQ